MQTTGTNISAETPTGARFLGSHNPAQVKRTLLASFTDALLLPVTIVPRTVGTVGAAVGAAITTGGTAAAQGIAMLNPQRWVAGTTSGGEYSRRLGDEGGGQLVFETGDDEEGNEEGKEDNLTVARCKHSFILHNVLSVAIELFPI